MISFKSISEEPPYKEFKKLYDLASQSGQRQPESMVISSFDSKKNEVDSRFVNLKYVINNEWVFFSNYLSPKALQFEMLNNVSIVFFWNKINTQIRIKAHIKKSSKSISNEHFNQRMLEKNILAISSAQSKEVNSYNEVKDNFNLTRDTHNNLSVRPDYWGGFSFTPYYFEFWEGRDSRLNKRVSYEFKDNNWKSAFLQP